MAGDRAPAFQFYPRDYMADPGVQRLTWDQRGRYVWALCCSALSDTPGEAPESDWAAWMGYDDSTWPAHRDAHMRCFKVTPERWVQRRLMETRAAQQAYASGHASAGGRARIASMDASMRHELAKRAAAARWAKPMPADASCHASGMLADASTASASASASAIAKNLQEHTRRNRNAQASPVKPPQDEKPTDPDDLSWLDLFAAWFWDKYPRKVGKPAALRAWKAIRPQNQETVDAIAKGLAVWKAAWSDPQFIPHPSTWLNQRRWEDKP